MTTDRTFDVAILGAGSIGLFTLQAVRASGASPIFVLDQFPWRLALAEVGHGRSLYSLLEQVSDEELELFLEHSYDLCRRSRAA